MPDLGARVRARIGVGAASRAAPQARCRSARGTYPKPFAPACPNACEGALAFPQCGRPTVASARANGVLLLQLLQAFLQPPAQVIPELGEAEQPRRLRQQRLLAQAAALAEQQPHTGLQFLRGNV